MRVVLIFLVASKDVSVCTCILRLDNKDPSQTVAFKVKTTAVKRYVVRPNVGILLPGQSVEVAVLLNYDRARAEGVDLATAHDRFQVLSVGMNTAVPDEMFDVWTSTPPEKFCKTMVKCKFVAPNLVKTVTPVAPSEAGSAEPGLEQAKQVFKQEMASSKAKQEVKALRAERDAAMALAKTREEQLAKLEAEVALLRRGGGSAAPRGVRDRVLSALVFALIYVVVLVGFFVCIYKVFDYDPFYSISRELSLTVLEQKLKRYLLSTLK